MNYCLLLHSSLYVPNNLYLIASLKCTETRDEFSTTCNLNKSCVKMPVSA